MKNDNITHSELEYMLEVNRKMITIYDDVAQQNEEIIVALGKLDDKAHNIEKIVEETNKTIKEQIEEKVEIIEKNVFRLIIILSSTGAGVVWTIIQSFLHH